MLDVVTDLRSTRVVYRFGDPTVRADITLARIGEARGIVVLPERDLKKLLDRTAFANVPNLRIVTEPASDPAWKRDRTLTREWYDWLERRDPERPFFGFLFYDSIMGRMFPPDHPQQPAPADGHPRADEFAGYLTAVNFVDGLIGAVLDDLRARGLLERTVVLISADHGEEFGESGEELEKHGSGYTRYQLGTPMVVAWPGREAGVVYRHRTSHYDVVPTLIDAAGGDNRDKDRHQDHHRSYQFHDESHKQQKNV